MDVAVTIIILVIIICLIIIAIKICVNRQITENFANNQTQKTCDTYFIDTNYIAACDKGYFNENILRLGELYNDLQKRQNSLTVSEKADFIDLKKTLDLRKKNENAGPITCKFTWPNNMVQHADTEMDPMKNTTDPNIIERNGFRADGSPNPNSDNWAFCYSPSGSIDDAKKQKKQFGDKGAIYADAVLDKPMSPFEDNQVWLRYKFRDLSEEKLTDAYCKIDVSNQSKLPLDFPNLLMGISVDKDFQVSDVNFYIKESDTKITVFNAPQLVFRKMFKTYYDASKKILYYREKPVNIANIKVLWFDPCGRVKQKASYSTTYPKGIFGIAPYELIKISDPSVFSGGTDVNALATRFTQLQTQLNDVEQKITSLELNNNITKYESGVNTTIYTISWSYHYNSSGGFNTNLAPPVENENHLTTMFSNFVKDRTNKILKHPTSSGLSIPWHTAIIFKGFLYVHPTSILKPGIYQFKINSDDASDMKIYDRMVSTYYGYHGADDKGIALCPNSKTAGCNDGWELTEGYHPYLIRYVQWHGNNGFRLKFRYKPSVGARWPSNFTEFNDSHAGGFVRDPTVINNDRLINVEKSNKSDIQMKMDEVAKLIDLFNKDLPTAEVLKVAEKLNGIKLPKTAMKYLSNDGRIYIDTGHTKENVPIIDNTHQYILQ